MTDLVEKQLWDSLLLNFNHIPAEDLLSWVSFIGVKTLSERFDRFPLGIPPVVVKDKFVLERMINKPHVSIIKVS